MNFMWDAEYSVGIPKFDKAHAKLFDIINDLIAGVRGNFKKEAVEIALAALLKYSEEHFAEEEEAMKKANYAGYQEQKEQHADFIEIVIALRAKVEAEPDMVSEALMILLFTWLKEHIRKLDKAYSPYLKGRV